MDAANNVSSVNGAEQGHEQVNIVGRFILVRFGGYDEMVLSVAAQNEFNGAGALGVRRNVDLPVVVAVGSLDVGLAGDGGNPIAQCGDGCLQSGTIPII